jgi:hypothetical protein
MLFFLYRHNLISLANSSNPTPNVSGRQNGTALDPPPYSSITATAPQTLVLDDPGPPISDPHHDAYCDRCDLKISGIRYKCTTCNDFDFCSVCIGFAPLEHGHQFEAIINRRTRLFRPMDEWRTRGGAQPARPLVEHNGVRCDICGVSPIRGVRWKCAVCPDWDACQGCLARSSTTHPEHTFIKVVDHRVLWTVRVYDAWKCVPKLIKSG